MVSLSCSLFSRQIYKSVLLTQQSFLFWKYLIVGLFRNKHSNANIFACSKMEQIEQQQKHPNNGLNMDLQVFSIDKISCQRGKKRSYIVTAPDGSIKQDPYLSNISVRSRFIFKHLKIFYMISFVFSNSILCETLMLLCVYGDDGSISQHFPPSSFRFWSNSCSICYFKVVYEIDLKENSE